MTNSLSLPGMWDFHYKTGKDLGKAELVLLVTRAGKQMETEGWAEQPWSHPRPTPNTHLGQSRHPWLPPTHTPRAEKAALVSPPAPTPEPARGKLVCADGLGPRVRGPSTPPHSSSPVQLDPSCGLCRLLHGEPLGLHLLKVSPLLGSLGEQLSVLWPGEAWPLQRTVQRENKAQTE